MFILLSLLLVLTFVVSPSHAALSDGALPHTHPVGSSNILPSQPRPGVDYVDEELIVLKRDSAEQVKVDAKADVRKKARDLKRGRGVRSVELNYIAEAQAFIPNDPFFERQWHLEILNLTEAWGYSTGNDVVVAVIDSGVTRVTDLADTRIVDGYDFVDNDDDPEDELGHGTHIAGTIAQSTNNAFGVAGIAHNAVIMPVRVLDEDGRGSYYDIYKGIRWAVDNGADVINLSLGGIYPSSLLERAIEYAYENGVVIVAASGNYANTSRNGVVYPAAYDDEVIAVGSIRYDKNRAWYSNGGNSLDFVAPGGDSSVDQDRDGYNDGILQHTLDGFMYYQGTSMAAAHISGLVALILQDENLDMDEVEDRLIEVSEDLGSDDWDRRYGHGLPNAALLFEGGSVTPTSTPRPTSTPTPTPTPRPTNTPTPIPPTPTPTPTVDALPTSTPTPTSSTPSRPTFEDSDVYRRICLRYPHLRFCN